MLEELKQNINLKIEAEALLFRGPENKPFLAPRGVWMSQDCLIVADTGQNRVFIWNGIPQEEFRAPDVVLGQTSTEDTSRNRGEETHAGTLFYPSCVWSDGKVLIVADAWNHRVLVWKDFPSRNGQAADVVIGQPDFHSKDPNVRGLQAEPSAQSLHWPYGVFSDGERLWIADTGNRRVLYFECIPDSPYAPADRVIGQESLQDREYESQNAIWPYSVKIGPQGALAITDTQFYRVLIWNSWETAFEKEADVIIGQENFEANGQNQFRLSPAAHTLNWCYDSCFVEEGIWVMDTGNSRVLCYDTLPKQSNTEAENLIGQPDFNSSSENIRTQLGTEKAMYWPFALWVHGDNLALADTGNHRIILLDKKDIGPSPKRSTLKTNQNL